MTLPDAALITAVAAIIQAVAALISALSSYGEGFAMGAQDTAPSW